MKYTLFVTLVLGLSMFSSISAGEDIKLKTAYERWVEKSHPMMTAKEHQEFKTLLLVKDLASASEDVLLYASKLSLDPQELVESIQSIRAAIEEN